MAHSLHKPQAVPLWDSASGREGASLLNTHWHLCVLALVPGARATVEQGKGLLVSEGLLRAGPG